jgi:hypothetical protein
MALAQFGRQVQEHNIPYWGRNCVVRVLNLADAELQDIPIGALLTLPTLPFLVSYPSLTLVEFHNCICCPPINYLEDSGNPPYEFHFKATAESQPSRHKKLSSSSFMAESQSSRCSLTSSVAESWLSSWYNGRSDNSSNPHSPELNNWQRNRSSNRAGSCIDGPRDDTSNSHSPGLDSWQSDGTNSEGEGSSSGIHNLETDDGQVPQGSSGSSSSSKG